MVAFPCMSTHTFDLAASASAEMIRQGFQPDSPSGIEQQVEEIRGEAMQGVLEPMSKTCVRYFGPN